MAVQIGESVQHAYQSRRVKPAQRMLTDAVCPFGLTWIASARGAGTGGARQRALFTPRPA